MLDHLRIAGKDIVSIQRAQELTVNEDTQRGIERADLILQPIEIDTGLAAYRRIHRGHQRGRDIDRADASLEGRTGEAAHIGHHATA